MAIYVYDRDRGIMVDKATGDPMNPVQKPLATPMVRSDLPGYASPIDGAWIEGRRARKYDLEKNGCIDANDLPSPTGGKLKNETFAKKHNLQHLLQK